MARSLVVESTGQVLATRLVWARSYVQRARGLIARDLLDQGDAFLIPGARHIHTFFMRFSIDVVFVDEDWRVVHVVREMRPWRASALVLRARLAIELPAGTIDRRIAGGDRLQIRAL